MSELASFPPAPSAGPGSGVRLHVLGEFTLRAHGAPVVMRRAQQRLLAFLAVSRRPVSRGALSQRLWDAVDDQHSASALRSNLWRLPRPTGTPLVTTTSSHVSLAEPVVVDLWERESVAERLARHFRGGRVPVPDDAPADPDVDEEPHATWTDDLLPEWGDEWLTVERESYRQLRLHALEHLSERLLNGGRHAAALMAALAAVQADPLRESAHRQVIAVHLDEGNPAEALRQFHVYRRMLAYELGLPPSPAIRELVAPLLGRPLENPRRRRDGARGGS
jgi:DNA-binding SARP family transcriptional activator